MWHVYIIVLVFFLEIQRDKKITFYNTHTDLNLTTDCYFHISDIPVYYEQHIYISPSTIIYSEAKECIFHRDIWFSSVATMENIGPMGHKFNRFIRIFHINCQMV